MVTEFKVLAASARDLIAAPLNSGNVLALRGTITSISYETYAKGSNALLASGTLDKAVVMFTSAQSWSLDTIGYTFLWNAPGTLWPLANKKYRIVVTFTPTTGNPYVLVWEADTTSTTGA